MGTVTLNISGDLYERARHLAIRRRQDVLQLIEEALDQGLSLTNENSDRDFSEPDETVDREEAAFHRLRPFLRQQYPDEYVAIYNGDLVDHDPDQVQLYLGVKTQHPGKFVWIAPVLSQPEEVYVQHSPRFVENLT